MSNKTQLQTNNTTLDALITRVNAAKETAASLPEGGSGGGESIETCTVEIHMSSGKKCYATTVNTNGNVVFSEVTSVNDYDTVSGGIAIIENVVCNSFIYCEANLNGMSITGTATIFNYNSKDYWTVLKSPSVANEHCIISW